MNTAPNALPMPGSIDAALQVIPVRSNWYIGRTAVGAFFARTRGELIFKYRKFVMRRQQHVLATAQQVITSKGTLPSFLDTHGFGGGQRVRYSPVIGGKHDGRIYTIAITGYLSDGTPVAWLNGKPGCVSLEALAHYVQGEDLQA